MKLIHVIWKDSGLWHDAGWEKKEKILENAKIGLVHTFGILLDQAEEATYIAASYDPDNEQYYGVQVISNESIIGYEVFTSKDKESVYVP